MIHEMSIDFGVSFKEAQQHYCDTVAKSRKLSFIDKEILIVEVKTLQPAAL